MFQAASGKPYSLVAERSNTRGQGLCLLAVLWSLLGANSAFPVSVSSSKSGDKKGVDLTELLK